MYGETSFELVTEIIKHTKLSENDVFVDLGSGELVWVERFLIASDRGGALGFLLVEPVCCGRVYWTLCGGQLLYFVQ